MAKSRQDELIKFDNRMTDYNLTRGNLSKEELEKYLASLPDLSAQAMNINLEDSDDSNDQH